MSTSSAPQSPSSVPDELPDFASDEFPYGVGRITGADGHVEYSTYDVGSALAILEAGTEQGDPFDVVRLTDEQIIGLDGFRRAQVTATPWVGQEEKLRPVLAAAGLRSLIASDMVTIAVDEESGATRWLVDPQINGCLVLRRTADVMCSAERQVNGETGEQIHRFYYYVHAEGVLEEEVSASGMHYFRSMPAEAVPARIALFVDQNQAASEGGEEHAVDPSTLTEDSELAQRLADARAVTILSALHADTESVKQMIMYATTTELFLLEPSEAEGDDAGQTVVRTIDSEQLLSVAAWLIERDG